MARPLCRCCGKPLRKATDRMYCHAVAPNTVAQSKTAVIGIFHTKAELAKVTNKQITSVEYEPDNEYTRARGTVGRVFSFGVWDGESYVSVYGYGMFCSLTCATAFAHAFAERGEVTVKYAAAKARQDQETRP